MVGDEHQHNQNRSPAKDYFFHGASLDIIHKATDKFELLPTLKNLMAN